MIGYNEFYLSLIRHGESEFNTTPDRIGQLADTPLTLHGRDQAEFLKERFSCEDKKFDLVFSSDYVRAHETAKIIAKDTKIILAPELREYSAGDWNGKSRKETIDKDIIIRIGQMGSGFLFPNGESMHMVERRASQWIEDKLMYNPELIQKSIERKKNKQSPLEIACFTHGMTIKCLLHYVMGFDQSFIWKLDIENTSISKLYFNEKGWRLLSINDHGHLV